MCSHGVEEMGYRGVYSASGGETSQQNQPCLGGHVTQVAESSAGDKEKGTDPLSFAEQAGTELIWPFPTHPQKMAEYGKGGLELSVYNSVTSTLTI